MGEHVAGAHAEVVGERSLKVLEVAAGLVDELEPDLALGRAAADEDLVAAVGQAEEVKGLEAARERSSAFSWDASARRLVDTWLAAAGALT